MGRVKTPKIKERERETCRVLICPICGKEYLPAPMHVYKMPTKNGRLVCSYSCALKAEREHEEKRMKRGSKPKQRG